MSKWLLILGVLTVGGILGSLYERNYQNLVSTSESSSIHYCSCIQDNPESYNILLTEVELINSDVNKAIVSLEEKYDLDGGYFKAILRISKNGNPITFQISTHRDLDETIQEEFSEIVNSHFSRYDILMAEMHKKYHVRTH